MKLEFFRQIFEKYANKNFTKIRPVGTELFHANRLTDGHSDRHDEAKAPKTRADWYCANAVYLYSVGTRFESQHMHRLS